MAKKTLSREAKRMGGSESKSKSTLGAAKSAVVKGAEKVAEVVTTAAESVQEHVIQPVAEAIGISKKPKRARFVRAKQEKKTPTKATKLPPRSTKASGKLMTKNVKQAPRETPSTSPQRHSK